MRKEVFMTAVLMCGCTAQPVSEPEPLTIAFVGDSIFYGTWAPNADSETIEAYFAAGMPEDTTVLNLGVSGATLQKSGDQPYTDEPEYQRSLDCEADYYVIMLGTNDAKSHNWNAENFAAEYRTFLGTYIALTDKNHVIAVIPPMLHEDPVYHVYNFGVLYEALEEQAGIIRTAAEELGVTCIDLRSLTQDHPEWFWDGVHPNAEGNEAIAREILTAFE